MFFQKAIDDLQFDDIKNFCDQYEEGYRVEYKSNFDQNVRKNVAKMVSAFANSRGGIIILGVETDGNKAKFPIKGFERPDNEEIRLTMQNMCRQSIYPAIFPAIKEIDTEIEGNIIVIIYVEESIEAPHAIENSTKVYIRTGDSSTPYNLADIKLLENLFSKKQQSYKLMDNFESSLQQLAFSSEMFDFEVEPYFEIVISPLFPNQSITSKESIYSFCRWARIEKDSVERGLFEAKYLRRINAGILSIVKPDSFININEHGFYGLIMRCKSKKECVPPGSSNTVSLLNFFQFCSETTYSILLMNEFYNRINWYGNTLVKIKLNNIKNWLLNISDYHDVDKRCLNLKSKAEIQVDTITMQDDYAGLIANILKDLIWPFNQSVDNFSHEYIKQLVDKYLKDHRLM